tara:strand:- start:2267 stop:2422 length:156 start_codon:yes stop_codon:yes gene_type:complete
MNTEKYKSVAVKKEVWEKLWKISKDNERSPASQVAWFVKHYAKIKKALAET